MHPEVVQFVVMVAVAAVASIGLLVAVVVSAWRGRFYAPLLGAAGEVTTRVYTSGSDDLSRLDSAFAGESDERIFVGGGGGGGGMFTTNAAGGGGLTYTVTSGGGGGTS